MICEVAIIGWFKANVDHIVFLLFRYYFIDIWIQYYFTDSMCFNGQNWNNGKSFPASWNLRKKNVFEIDFKTDIFNQIKVTFKIKMFKSDHK